MWRANRNCPKSLSNQSRPAKVRRPRLFVEQLEKRELLSASVGPDYVIQNAGLGPQAFSSPTPTGYSPDQIRQAYGFNRISFLQGGDSVYNANAGSGQTIAIIDAHDDPNIVNDLAAFDRQFNLPGQDAASVDRFFTKVNQEGGATLPSADGGAAVEIALDVEWAHAIAPAAKILLVEANSNFNRDLETAIQFAANQPGVSVVSMSFNGAEFANEFTLDGFYTTPVGHAGVAFVGASGDGGSPPGYQSSSPNVLAVGGTTLKLDAAGNPLSETGWAGSGGGLSSVEVQPAFQKGVVTQSTSRRATPDVAYDADPSTGFPVYDTFNNPASAPWEQVGGTSAGTPQWAALIALADQARAANGLTPLDGPHQLLPLLYSAGLRGDFTDITQGLSAGFPTQFAGPGFDLVTGLGSPLADALVRDLGTADVTATASTVTWTGAAGDGNWDNPANWSGGVLPGPNNDVVIHNGGTAPLTINHSANQYDTIRSLVVTGGNVTLNLISGTLDLSGGGSDGTFSVSQAAGNSVILDGGVLKDALVTADTTISSPFNTTSEIIGGQLNGTINVGPIATLTVAGRGTNNGTIQGGFGAFINLQVGAGWTNGASGVITLNGAIMSLSGAGVTNAGTITITSFGDLSINSDGFVNSGVIQASGSSSVSIGGAGWTNTAAGRITVGASGKTDSSNLSLLNDWTNNGSIAAFGGTTLQLGDLLSISASDPAAGSDAWVNNGTITATSANVSLGGWLTYTATNLNSLSLAGDTVSLIGTLDNRGHTLTLGGSASFSPASWKLAGGRIDGGTIATTNGAALVATSSGGTLDGVTNTGVIQDTNFSKLALVGAWVNAATGVITVSGFSAIQLGDLLNISASDPAAGSDAWVNNGVISISNSTVSLGGWLTYTATNLNSLSLAGNTVNLVGTLDNRGQTLTLGGSASFSPGSWTMAGGRIDGGTVASANGAALKAIFTPSGLLGTLDGVTLNGTLDMTGGEGIVTVVNGLVLNGTVLLGGASSFDATLTFDDTHGAQTLSGTGKVVFGTSFFPNFLRVMGGGVLTIGSGITIDGPPSVSFFGFTQTGVGSITGPIDNKGDIEATAGTFAINVPLVFPSVPTAPSLTAPPVAWSNEGTIHVSGGHLDLGGAFTNSGTIAADSGTFINLGDIWNTSPAENANAANDAWVNTGTITLTTANVSLGGWLTYGSTSFQSLSLGTDTVSLIGTLDNAGHTLALLPGIASATGSWSLAGGRILQGTVDATAANLLATSSGGTLDGVTLVGVLDMKSNQGAAVTVINNLTLNGSVQLGGGSNRATLTFDDRNGAQTLSGAGSILFGNSVSFGFPLTNVLTVLGGNGGHALTIGSGIFISASGASQITGPIDNQGTMQEASGGSLSINFQNVGLFGLSTPIVWTNEGTIHVSSGSLNLGGPFTNSGTITADAGTSIALGDGIDASPTGFNPVAKDGWVNTGTITATKANVSLGGFLTYGPTNFQSLALGTDAVSLIGTLDNTGHTLTLSPGVTSSSGSWLLAGGRIYRGIVATTDGAALIATNSGGGGFDGALDGVTLDGKLDMSASGADVLIENGLTLNTDVNVSGSGAGIFVATDAVFGPAIFAVGSLVSGATINLSGQGATLSGFSGGSFELEQGITVAGGNSFATILGSFDNKGVIQETAGGLLDVNFNQQFSPFGFFFTTPWSNEGTIHVSSGSIRLGNVFTNRGTIEADSGTGLGLGDSWNTSPAESFFALSDQWFNLGTIVATGVNVLLGGWLQYTALNLNSLSLAGDTVTLIGTLDNRGHTLTLGGSDSFSPGSWKLGGGRVLQGTVASANGAALVATTNGGTLDGVTLNGVLDMQAASAAVHVINNLTLNGLVELGGPGGNANLSFTTFFTPQTISGSGSIQFGAGPFNVLQANAFFGALTIGPGITVAGPAAGGSGLLFGAIDNKGVIQETLGGTLDINFDQVSLSSFFPLVLTNEGTVHVSNGALRVGNAFTNSGAITADAGASLTLGDDWNTSPAESFRARSNAWVNTGTITASGANVALGGWLTNTASNLGSLSLGSDTVSLIGTLNNSGQTLALRAGSTSSAGSWSLAGGRVFQGTVDATSAPLVATAKGGTLDGATLDGTLDMQTNASAIVNVLNSLTLNGVVELGGASGHAALNFNGFFSRQTLSGTGSVVFGSGPAGSLNVNSFFPLTIGCGITVFGGASSGINGPINNQGVIEEATAGGTLTVGGPISNFSAGTLTGGVWEAADGGVLLLRGVTITTNAATIVLDGSGSLIEGDAGTTDALAGLASNAAGARLTVGNGAAVSTSSAVSNAGTLDVGGGGTFRTAGDYTQTAGATTVDGSLTAGNFFLNGGTLNGTGTVNANLTNAAEVDPGDGTGTLTVAGDYTQTSTGVLNIRIVDSSHFGQLAVGGAVTLGGALDVLTAGYVDSTLDSFQVLTFQQRPGATDFAAKNGLALADGQTLNPTFHDTDLTLSVNNFVRALQDVPTGSVLLATFTVSGPVGSAGDYTATVQWGDGSSDSSQGRNPQVTVAVSGSQIIVRGQHTYKDDGLMFPTVTLTNAAGQSLTTPANAITVDVASDVTHKVHTSQSSSSFDPTTGLTTSTLTVTAKNEDDGASLSGAFDVVLTNLTAGATLQAATVTVNGVTFNLTISTDGAGDPMIVIPRSLISSLASGQSFTLALSFSVPAGKEIDYDPDVFSDPLGS
jgi:hypothetical protein